MNSKNTDLIKLTLQEHLKLLEKINYKTNIDIEKIEKEKQKKIYYNGKVVGNITIESRNMYYLHKDKRIVGNKDLSIINFSTSKSKNIRTLIHTRIYHNNLVINCFNMLISDDRLFIILTDGKNISISKIFGSDKVIVNSLIEDISDDEILDNLRMNKYNKSLVYKLDEVIK